jgi:hypothetical protein
LSKPDQNHISQYLNSHAHDVDLDCFLRQFNHSNTAWHNVVILPVCGEKADCLDTVFEELRSSSALVIVCLNRPQSHVKSNQWHQQNHHLKHLLIKAANQIIKSDQGHRLLIGVNGLDILLLDFNEQPFDQSKGVGLARKIAADTALKLIYLGKIACPWIFSTDADVTLPNNYFSVVNDLNDKTSAISIEFLHGGTDSQALLYQQQYDFKLQYYRQGVEIINSKYAYIPLGSTLVINAIAYAKVRGFPIRSGGEDFYILNKLAKVGQIYNSPEPVIKIQIRYSDRVPFGTGPAISQLAESQNEPKYYHPDVFFMIKDWRDWLLHYFKDKTMNHFDHGLNDFWQIEAVLDKASRQFKSEKLWHHFVNEWFDAFKILRSVHFLSETYLPVEKSQLILNKSYKQLIELTKN